MKYIKLNLLLLLSILMLNGCTAITPIKKLALPPVNTIQGTIEKIDKNGFFLKDNSGSIYVKIELSDNKKINISENEEVTVYGNLEGTRKVFDAYVIKKSSGKQIIITNPKPHIGFIIQTAFE